MLKCCEMKLAPFLLLFVAAAAQNPASHFQIQGVQTGQNLGKQLNRGQSRFATSVQGQRALNRNNQPRSQVTNHFQINNNRQSQIRPNTNRFNQRPAQQVSPVRTNNFQQQQRQQQQRQQQQQQQQQRQQQQQQRQQQQQQQRQQPQPQQSSSSNQQSSGTLLALPDPELCKNRPKQWKFGNHYYYFSWDQNDVDDKGQPAKVDWLEARNKCRVRCMDTLGIESEAENNMVVDFMKSKQLKYIWTAGRLCDFTGCDRRKDLHPINVFGWFWSNTNTKTAPTNSTPPGWLTQPWSHTGHTGVPQPDNAEFDINKTPESCLAVLNDIYKDGIKWHDIACYHEKPYICEDSELLLNYVKSRNPGINLGNATTDHKSGTAQDSQAQNTQEVSQVRTQNVQQQSEQKQMPEKQMPEKQMPVKQMPEKQMPEKQMPEKQMPEKQMPEKQMPEKQMTGQAEGENKESSANPLSFPDPEKCKTRPKQWKFGNHYYYFSWDQNDVDEKGEPAKVNWLEARNRCRVSCMDTVGIESEEENKMIFEFLRNNSLRYIWTAGRLCDFTGCERRRDLHPVNVFGWFWSNTNTKAAPTNSTPEGWAEQPWSQTGHTGDPQPDNAEFDINRTPESCLAVLNNLYNDGIKWHDIACYHPKPYICEDSELLLNYVKSTNPGIDLS